MTTESEAKLARYSETIIEVDEFARRIGVRRLKPSEQTKIAGFTAELFGSDEMIDNNGNKHQVSHRMPLMLAAAVCVIDDALIPFPRSRGELDAIYDRLDEEGLRAAGKAWVRLNPTAIIVDPKDESKNL